MIGSCVLSNSRATKWTPYELILSESIFSYIRYYGNTAYIRSYTAYIQYMEPPCTVWANPTYITYASHILHCTLYHITYKHPCFILRRAQDVVGLISRKDLLPENIDAQFSHLGQYTTGDSRSCDLCKSA